METKLNIAEILKDKPQGTVLYSPLFGDIYLLCVSKVLIKVTHHETLSIFQGNGKYYNYSKAELLLFPSKGMRDWSKFAWKKGDVLVSKGRRILHVIFEGFNDDTYTTFKGKHYLCDYVNKEDYDDEEYYNDYYKEVNKRTIDFEKDNVNNAQTYINIIEKRLGGKLNLKTLEIEKAQSEFKKGDIAFADYGYKQAVFIVSGKTDLSEGYNSFIALDLRGLTLDMGCRMSFLKKNLSKLRLATEEEKQQLFDALAKKGKAWDAEKKEVVDLKPKVVFKPFDKVLVRDCLDEMWRPSFFAGYLPFGREPYQVIGGEWVKLCIPYEGNESLLGTTKDVEG